MAECAELGYIGYFRSRAGLVGNTYRDLLESLRVRLARDNSAVATADRVANQLRALVELCKRLEPMINAATIQFVTRCLLPLALNADRENQRLAHILGEQVIFPK